MLLASTIRVFMSTYSLIVEVRTPISRFSLISYKSRIGDDFENTSKYFACIYTGLKNYSCATIYEIGLFLSVALV